MGLLNSWHLLLGGVAHNEARCGREVSFVRWISASLALFLEPVMRNLLSFVFGFVVVFLVVAYSHSIPAIANSRTASIAVKAIAIAFAAIVAHFLFHSSKRNDHACE